MKTKQIDFNKLEVKEDGEIRKKTKSIKHSKEQALEKSEQKRIIEVIKELDIKPETRSKYRVLIYLMMKAGLRVGEAVQVRYEWFKETDDGVLLVIPNEDRDIRNRKKVWNPKTKAGRREIIFLEDSVGHTLLEYFLQNKNGLYISRQRAAMIVKLLGDKINKPKLHCHALRSTYANNLVYEGVNASTLCYLMGWSDLNVALNYIKSSPIEARRDLIAKFRRRE